MIPCLKRTVHCIILNDRGEALAWGRNMCLPPIVYSGMIAAASDNGTPKCARDHIKAQQEGYSATNKNECNSIHAEVAAVAMLRTNGVHHSEVQSALLLGHDFCCEPCLQALWAAGVCYVDVLRPDGTTYRHSHS